MTPDFAIEFADFEVQIRDHAEAETRYYTVIANVFVSEVLEHQYVFEGLFRKRNWMS